MGRSTVHYADNETNNILKRLHNKLRPAGTPVERVEYIIELLLLRIFETKLKQDEVFKPLRKIFAGENYRLLFSYIHSLSNGDRILLELNKTIFPFYATILQEARKVVKGNLPPKMQDQLVLMEEVFADSNFTSNVKGGGVITEVIGLINDIDEKYILKTDLLGDAIESALSETGGTKDLGLYRTPDHIRRMMVAMIDPDFTDNIFDPACGTAGFLFDTYDYVIDKANETGNYPSTIIANMFYRTGIGGIEYQGRIRKMAAVNMYIRGLNPHNIMQGDSLKMYDPARDAGSKSVVIANPPFGAERDQPAYPNVWEEYAKESETTVLFVKLMFDYLKAGGRCAVVVSEGFLTWGQGSACALRKLLLNEANLRAIISLPQGVFVSKSGQGAKTSILYFEKGQPTDFVWYYKIENDGFSMGTNRKAIEGSQIPELLSLFKEVKQGQKPEDTPRSFCIDREQIETLDPQIKERLASETREKTIERNALKREKKITELDKKIEAKKINKVVYKEELSQFDSNFEAQLENEITKAIEKAHTYHFNLQNYRAIDDDKKMEFPLVELKKLITAKAIRVSLENDVIYKQVTIKLYGKGVLQRQEIEGKYIKTAGQYIVSKGDFIMSKIDARNGAFGLVPDFLDGAVVTSSFPYFEINKSKINPKFLEYSVTQPKFYEKINEMVSGATGRRSVEVSDFLQLLIPLPPLEIQNKVVEKIEKQKEIIEGAGRIENNCSIDILIGSNTYPKLEIGSLILTSMYGTSNKADYQESGYPVLRIGNIGFCNFDLSDLKKIELDNKEYEKLKLNKGDFLIVRSNGNPALVGKCAVWDGDNTFVYASYLIRFIFDTHKILPKYVMYYFMSPKGREQLVPKQGGGTYNISSEEFKKFSIPLPPLSTQHQIVEKLDRQMAALESVRFLKAKAEKRIEEILAGMWKEKPIEIIPNVVLNENVVEEKYFLKRTMLGVYIINQSLNDDKFGDTKFEKIMHLTEYWAIKRNLNQQYRKQVAGPYDNRFTFGFYDQITKAGWFNIQKTPNSQSKITTGKNHEKSQKDYGYFSSEELEKVNLLLEVFKNADYKVPEVVSTLYAVWNNRIILKQEISDEILIQDFYGWGEHKTVYTKQQLEDSLKWMRAKEIVPDGWGEVIEKAEKKQIKKQK